MKILFQRRRATSAFTKVLEWGKLVTITGISQTAVQAVGFICGILVIRLLPTNEYALYTLANTMVGTMAVLADGGISTGVISQGGQVWRDKEKLGAVLATGFDLRKRFAIASLLIAVPVMLMLLQYHNATWVTSVLIVVAVIPAFFSTLSGSLLQVAPKLHQDITPLQKNQVTSNIIRFFLLSTTLFFFPFAFIAILAASASQIWFNLRLKQISRPYADWGQKPDPQIRKGVIVFVRRLLPGSIYYCLSGQITIWLISVFGTTAALAQVGALARLTMVLSVLSIMLNMLVVPRFARLLDSRKILIHWYLRIQFYMFLFSFVFVTGVWLFSGQILWVLGKNYAGLDQELVLSVVGGCLNLAVGINFTLNSSRGWLMHPAIGISVGMASIIAGVLLLDVSTLQGVLMFNIFTGIVGLFIHPLFGLLRILKKERSPDLEGLNVLKS